MPNLSGMLGSIDETLDGEFPLVQSWGQVIKISDQLLEVSGCDAGIGSVCVVDAGGRLIAAEVIGFNGTLTYLMAYESTDGILPKARVSLLSQTEIKRPTLDALLGRIVDGRCRPLDGRALERRESVATNVNVKQINPLDRKPVSEILNVGIRAINALLTVGVGQRIGLFAGSGVGKSVLLGSMARFASADVTVVGLIGERGREVQEFVQDMLGDEGLKNSVVVASPGDDSPVLRRRAAFLATEIAERYRDEGKRVLLLMDSLSRVAQAQREIGLNLGEVPATKGYTPSVFSLLPKLVERAGNIASNAGSITAVYTVLAEGDDLQDPIVDAARAILDGHIILSRRLADAGHYPAIEVSSSISRTMSRVCTDDRIHKAIQFKELWSRYLQQEDLISIGAYVPGSDALTDKAIALRPEMEKYLRQGPDDCVNEQDSFQQLDDLLSNMNRGAAAPELNSALVELGAGVND